MRSRSWPKTASRSDVAYVTGRLRAGPCKFVPCETDSQSMRALLALGLCGLVVLFSGWTSGMHQAPPTCATPVNPLWGIGRESGSRVIRAVQIPGPSGTALYTRWCGPATARVHLDGASFLLRSGHCIGKPKAYFVRVGLIANPPARPAKWVGLFIRAGRAAQPGTFRLAERTRASRTRRSSLAVPSFR